MNVRTVTTADLDAIATAVAARVQPDPLPQFLTVAEVSERLAVSETWVYENSKRLGASRLGKGKRATLRFDARTIATFMDDCRSEAA